MVPNSVNSNSLRIRSPKWWDADVCASVTAPSALFRTLPIHQYDMDLSGTMHAADQDLLDVGRAAWPRDEDHSGCSVGRTRNQRQHFVKVCQELRARKYRDIAGRQ